MAASDTSSPPVFDDLEACVDLAIERVGRHLAGFELPEGAIREGTWIAIPPDPQ